MNLPNKLTTLRVILVPFFVAALLLPHYIPGQFDFMTFRIAAIAIFIIASLTDTADGYIARKYNLVTNFGKFMDPLADKLLVCSAMICMIELASEQTVALPSWVVAIIIAREFIISGFRLIASDNGVVIAASYWGKFKTVFQMLMIIAMLFDFLNSYISFWAVTENVSMWIALVLTIVSLIDYIAKNKDVLKDQK